MNEGRLRERAVQRIGVQMLRALGCQVYIFADGRTAPTRNSLGVPDVYFFLPGGRGAVWWEVKAHGGKPNEHQVKFAQACLASGMRYVCGGLPELRALLAAMNVTVEPIMLA